MSEAHMRKIQDDLVTAELSRASTLSVENQALRDEVARLRSFETVQSVTEWANKTFGPATLNRQIKRAFEEFYELIEAQAGSVTHDRLAEEAADVVICLYRVIGTLDPEAINRKMAKNRTRTWKVDGEGCAYHVKQAALTPQAGGKSCAHPRTQWYSGQYEKTLECLDCRAELDERKL